VRNVAAVLNKGSLHLNDVTVLSAVLSNKLSNDGERTVSIDGLPFAKETSVTGSVGVEITTVLVADTLEAMIPVAAFKFRIASVLTRKAAAGVQCVGSRR